MKQLTINAFNDLCLCVFTKPMWNNCAKKNVPVYVQHWDAITARAFTKICEVDFSGNWTAG